MPESRSAATATGAEHASGRTVAVVGLGSMGGPIAGHLARSGLRPLVSDLDSSLVAAQVAAGGRPVTAATLAAADVVLLMVPADSDVRAVCLGGGLAAALPEGAVLCICSSVRPQTCQEIAEVAGQADVLDTALTGGVRGAEAGTVNLLVGGDASALARARWALEPWTATIHHLGALGSGQIAKTCNNMLHWAQICAIEESLRLGHRMGLDVQALRAALLDAPVASRTLAELEQMRLTWHAKDLANALDLGQDASLDLPVARLSQQRMRAITPASLADLLHGSAPGHGVTNR